MKMLCMATFISVLGLNLQNGLFAQNLSNTGEDIIIADYRIRQRVPLTPDGDNDLTEYYERMAIKAEKKNEDNREKTGIDVFYHLMHSGQAFNIDDFLAITRRKRDTTFYYVSAKTPKSKPLLIVDGCKVKAIRRIPLNNIGSISAIYDSEKAMELYGNKAKNGVIIIKTRK